MNLKSEHVQHFIVMDKSPITTKRTNNGRLQSRQELRLRCFQANENEGNHCVLFFDGAIKHSDKISVGDNVELRFILHAGISTTGITHTNIVPTKISIV